MTQTNIDSLRARQAGVVDQMAAMTALAGNEDRDFTADEQTQWQELEAQDKALSTQIGRMTAIEQRRAQLAVPLTAAVPTPNQPGPIAGLQGPYAAPRAPYVAGTNFARIITALAATKGQPMLAAQWAEAKWGPEGVDIAAALGSNSGAAGGFLVPDRYSAEVIDLLRSRTVIRRAGARTLPMPGGNLLLPRLATGSSASYIGENQNLPKTEPTFGQIRMTSRKLAALVPISNDLIRVSSPQADAVVRDDLLNSMAVAEDAAFIRDAGLGNAPKGLRYWALPTSTQALTVNATVNLANVTVDLGRLELAVIGADVPMVRPVYLMAPRTLNYLRNIRDGNGNYGFPEVSANMTISPQGGMSSVLRGFPVYTTTSIPVNLAVTGTNESEIYFVDMNEAFIGEETGIMVDVSDVAAYHDGSNVQAAFSLDQTVIRAITKHDFALRHGAAAAVLTDVDWV